VPNKKTHFTNLPEGRKGNLVVSIIEQNISKVLVGPMPYNRHINKARETLIFMIENLPTDNIIYSFIMKNISTAYTFNARVVAGKLIPNNSYPWK